MPARWGTVAAYAAVAGANQLLWLTYAPITTDTAEHYGVSEAAVGWLSQVFPLLYVVLAIPAGIALDRAFRPALLTGAWLTVLGGAIRFGDTYAAALAGQLLIATGQPLILNAVTKVAVTSLRVMQRPHGIALGTAGIFAGTALALPLGPALGDATTLTPLLIVDAVIALAAATALTATLRESPEAAPGGARASVAALTATLREGPEVAPGGARASVAADPASLDARRSPAPGAAPSGAPASSVAPSGPRTGVAAATGAHDAGAAESGDPAFAGRRDLRAVWADRGVKRLAAVAFLGFGVFVAITTWLQALLEPEGIDDTTVGWLLAAMVLAGVVASATLPPLLVRHKAERTFLKAASLSAAASCLTLAIAPGAAAVVVVPLGVALLGALPVILELTERRAGQASGAATALVWLAGNTGGIVIAVLVQALSQQPTAAFVLLAGVAALVLAFV